MNDEYTGFKEFHLDNDAMVQFYLDIASPTANEKFGCLTNEYVLLYDTDDELKDCYRCDESGRFIQVIPKNIRTKFMDVVKPRNPQQRIAVDMLMNNDITVKMLAGKYGTGKDYLMSAAAIKLLEDGKIEKIVYVRNNIEVKDSKPIGHLPGTSNEKLMPFCMVLADKLGGADQLERMIMQEKIEIVHLGFLRGRDLKNCVVYCSEAENLSREHVQLLLGRIGQGSSLWLNGDCRQVDLEVFAKNSGMRICVDKLKGHPRFGYVKLLKTERSETAAMADLLD